MKKITIQKSLFQFISWGGIVILLWAIFSNFAFGQSPPPPPPPPETGELVHIIEKMPILKSCSYKDSYNESKKCSDEKLIEIIYSNLKIPLLARQNSIEGMVVIQFIVEKDGKTSGHKIARDIGGECGEEALRVVKLLDEWEPGTQRGRKVSVTYNVPVKFKL